VSELTKSLREEYTWRDGQDDLVEPPIDPNVIALCDEHERLEVEHERLRGECAMAHAERDAFCSLTTQATRELDRLEGLLSALGAACAHRNYLTIRYGSACTAEQWDELTAANDDVDKAREPVYAEAVRLAKEKP